MKSTFGITLVLIVSGCANLSAQTGVTSCDAYSTLQECIDAATGKGSHPGTAVMPPNLERDISATVHLYSNMTLRCESGALIKQAANANISAMLQNVDATSSTGPDDSNITIDGCTIDGNRIANTGAGTVGISLYAQPAVNGKPPFKVSNVKIRNSTIQNTSTPGIYGFNWQYVEISGNTFINDAGFLNTNDGAIYLVSTNGASKSVWVHDNRCDATQSETGCFKFAASDSYQIIGLDVSHNILTVGDGGSTGTLGIELFSQDGGDTGVQQFVVADNVVNAANTTNTQIFGISIGGARYGSVTGNTVNNTNAFGIETIGSYVTVSNNVLNNTGPLDWDGNTAPHTNVVISNNVIIGPGCRGIFFISSGNNYLDTGIVSNNIIRGPIRSTCSDPSAPAAVRLQNNMFNIRFIYNTIQELQAGSNAIETDGGAQTEINANRFVNNHGTGLYLSWGTQGVNFTIKDNYYNGEGTFLVPHNTTITQQSSNIVNGVIQ